MLAPMTVTNAGSNDCYRLALSPGPESFIDFLYEAGQEVSDFWLLFLYEAGQEASDLWLLLHEYDAEQGNAHCNIA
jgi:hypothetical protein